MNTPEAAAIADYYRTPDAFAWAALKKMLSVGGSLFENREFALTHGPRDKPVFRRYLSFRSIEDLQREIVSKGAWRIDIGAVYQTRPSQFARRNLVAREMVFDVDVSDYDDVRPCRCMGASVCTVCWLLVRCAVIVLQRVIKVKFGVTPHHIKWFFSGRRGVHAWLLDDNTRFASAEMRKFMVYQITQCREMKRDKIALRTCRKFYQLAFRKVPPSNNDELTRIMWPRIDVPVSTAPNHLLKAPYSVHPQTGKVCVSFNPREGGPEDLFAAKEPLSRIK